MNLFKQLIKILKEFLEILRKSAISNKLDIFEFIDRTTQMIHAMFDANELRDHIKEIVLNCDWDNYFFDLDFFFKYLINDLKAMLPLLIAICEKKHDPNVNDKIDMLLNQKLNDLFSRLQKMRIFYIKIEDLDGMIPFSDKSCGKDCKSLCGNKSVTCSKCSSKIS